MKYRSDIDGLRALAVLPVILFHAGFTIFSGGYVGVDVFFVISGYLITGILLEDIKNGTFSIRDFYERRSRRILPALTVVMLVCIPAAQLWLTPKDLQEFYESVMAVSTFTSNILFMTQSGYFDTAAELRPLLHTWSLAVEEQYYIFFPLLLLGTWRFGVKTVVCILGLIFVLSLTLAHWGSANKPTEAYYLLLTRAWELMVGAFAAFYVAAGRPRDVNSKTASWLALSGFAAILISVFVYTDATPFPSLYTLLPVIGAVLIILFSARDTLSFRILSLAPVVFIGQLSYSAYLWHQPLLAFAKYRSLDEPPTLLMAGVVIASLALSYITWKFVETPFRKRHTHLKWYGLLLLIMISGAAIGRYMAAAPGVIDEKVRHLVAPERMFDSQAEQCTLEKDEPYAQPACLAGYTESKRNMFLLGDSLAQSIYPELRDKLASRGINLMLLAYIRCVPLIDEEKLQTYKSDNSYLKRHISERCSHNKQQVNEILSRYPVERVLVLNYLQNWITDSKGRSFSDFESLYFDSLVGIKQQYPTTLLGILPHWPSGLPQIMASELKNHAAEDLPIYSARGVSVTQAALDAALAQKANNIGVEYISILRDQCQGNACQRYVVQGDQYFAMNYDGIHLTRQGAARISNYLSQQLP